MTSRNVTNIAQTGYVGKNFLATLFAMSRFELVEATVSPEKSSSYAGIGGYTLLGLKKNDLLQLRKKLGLTASGNKPDLLVWVLWRISLA